MGHKTLEINFEFVVMKTISGNEEVGNIKELVAESIYARCGGLKYRLLAEKIYKSPSPCELEDEEVELLARLARAESGIFSNKVADALRELLEKGE
nr:MAG TPA: hypothetical protein [Caudoviricetes sp.]